MAYAQYRDSDEPEYTLIASEDGFELRDYPEIIVAEVTHKGSRRTASSRSFRRLAAYIFAQDRPEGGERIAMTSPVLQERVDQNEKIAMTAPVLQDQERADSWRMRFVMPAQYTLETLPTPPADIELSAIAPRRMAVVRFSGNGAPRDLEKMEERLGAIIATRGLTPVGSYEYAFYDAPMVPGPLRRNEVMIEVASEQ